MAKKATKSTTKKTNTTRRPRGTSANQNARKEINGAFPNAGGSKIPKKSSK